MRFAANLFFLFTELPFLERFAAARRAGFGAVEFLFPDGVALDDIVHARAEAGVEVALMNLPHGDWAAGERGLACLPAQRDAFRAAVEVGIDHARALACPRVHAVAGIVPPGTPRDACLDTLVENLRLAADRAAPHGIEVMLEPINQQDMPGFVVSRSADALAVLDRAGRPNLKLQYDLYHMQIMEGDLIATLRRLRDRIGHVQFADVPGRHEPGTGEIHFANVFAALAALGYDGAVGAEYRPSGRTEDSLGWFSPYRTA